MLKKYINIAALSTILVLGGTSCGADLEVKPFLSGLPKDVITSETDVQTVLIGGYEALTSTNAYGSRMLLNAELLGASLAEIRWRGTFDDPRQFSNKYILVNNADVAAMWLAAYRTINGANLVLENMALVKDETAKNRIEGEAKFLRAIMHFEILRIYGKPFIQGSANNDADSGVPIQTKTNNTELLKRSTISEVYAVIEADLKDAEAKLPASNGVYADKSVAAAFLSRVYLQQYKYAEARDAANRVITGSRRTLAATVAACFNNAKNSSEDLFAIQSNAQDNVNQMASFFVSRRDVQYLPGMLNQFASNDARRALFFVGAGSRTLSGKWTEQNNAVLPVIRLAEMYLIRAEANFALTTSVGASPLEDINRIRQRANLSALTSLTVDDIRRERKLELIAEGHLIHDLKRWKGAVTGFDAGGNTINLNYDAPALVAPIPQREMNVNPNLKQNAGY